MRQPNNKIRIKTLSRVTEHCSVTTIYNLKYIAHKPFALILDRITLLFYDSIQEVGKYGNNLDEHKILR